LKIELDLEISDEWCADVMSAALEGGIGYWCAADSIQRDGLGFRSFIAYDAEDENAFKPKGCDRRSIRLGVERILSGEVKVNKVLCGCILAGVTSYDSGLIDADAADCIVQAGLFNDLVFG